MPAVISRTQAIPADAVKLGPENDPTPPILHNPQWLDPFPLPGPVNTAGSEDSPFISPDGTLLFFFFTPDSSVPAEQQLKDGATGIYYTARSSPSDPWAEPLFLPLAEPGEPALNGCPTLHENTLWFCSARAGGFRPLDMYTASFNNGSPSSWENAGEVLNREIGIGEMDLSTSGQDMYFHADLPGGLGGFDIWMTSRSTHGWTAPRNVSAVNSAETEGWPYLSPDGSELWFTRTWQGAPAVFRSRWNGEQWGEPELIISRFAGEPTLDAAGNLYFVHHFVRDGQILEADIFLALRRSP